MTKPYLIVRRADALSGTVRVGGSKNSVLKLMAATLLAEGRHRIHNVPAITDVDDMADLLVAMGLKVERDGTSMTIDRPAAITPEAPWELVERFRASIAVLGPLLAREGVARVALPGGDDFGHRPIDMHLGGLQDLGATFRTVHGFIEGEATHLRGARVALTFPSVGATENLLMAAVLAEGTTVIYNAAREPEIADLAEFLNGMGGRIRGAGTPTIEVDGVSELHPAEHTVIPDRIEAATYLGAVGAVGGEITVEAARNDHMEAFTRKLTSMGMRVCPQDDGIRASADRRLRSVDVSTLPYPGVATDYKPLFVAMLTVADGVGIVTENIFQGRFRYVAELVRMGADIETEEHHAVVRGKPVLSGAPVRAPDIRAGAALVIAGLCSEGQTVIADAHHLDRGYEHLEAKLRGLGCDVERAASF